MNFIARLNPLYIFLLTYGLPLVGLMISLALRPEEPMNQQWLIPLLPFAALGPMIYALYGHGQMKLKITVLESIFLIISHFSLLASLSLAISSYTNLLLPLLYLYLGLEFLRCIMLAYRWLECEGQRRDVFNLIILAIILINPLFGTWAVHRRGENLRATPTS